MPGKNMAQKPGPRRPIQKPLVLMIAAIVIGFTGPWAVNAAPTKPGVATNTLIPVPTARPTNSPIPPPPAPPTNTLIPVPTARATNTPIPPADCSVLGWSRLVNVRVSAGSIIKTSPANQWDSGATSNQQITAGNGGAFFTASQLADSYMFGLSNTDPDPGYSHIGYAMFVRGNQIDAYVNGANIGNIGTYAPGNNLSIWVSQADRTVTYAKGGVTLLRLTNVTLNFPLMVDTSVYSGHIEWSMICGTRSAVVDFTPTPRPSMTATPSRTPVRTATPTND